MGDIVQNVHGVEEAILAKDHPLREMLSSLAPGTASHSERIASLIEALGTAAHLNVQRLRCAALLHDIGKVVTPWLYSENQRTNKEKAFHDTVDPHVSATLLMGHVAHTTRVLVAHGTIPRDIIDWCSQHHGTCILEQPWRRAVKDHVDAGGLEEEVDSALFRYPGPKPTSLEACLLMVCDQTEAMTRALSQSGKLASCKDIVERVFDKLGQDHQIDNVPFIYWQLRTIKDVLTRELESSYHTRVDYETDESAPAPAYTSTQATLEVEVTKQTIEEE